MRTKYQLLWGSLFFSFLLPSCIADSLSGSSDEGVMLQPSFSLAPVQAEVRNAQNFSPEEGSQFTVERTDNNGTSKAIYTIKDSKMLSDAPLLLPKAGTYSFRIYGRSGDTTNGIPVAFYDDAEVSKEGNASFSLHIVCAAMQVQLQNTDGTPIAKGNAKISLPELHGCGVFKTDFTVADETAIEVDNNSTPSGHNDEDLLFHPTNELKAGSELITISYEGKTYRYSLPSGPDFKAGRRYIYTLRLGTSKAELVTVDIADFKPFILTKDNNNDLAGIYTEEDLIAFREAINNGSSIDEWSVTEGGNNIINLYNDIKLTREWTPIKSFNNLQFNGNGHTISELTIKQATEESIGFFGEVSGSTIENLNLTNANIEFNEVASESYYGVLCGSAVSSSKIQNIHIKNIVIKVTSENKIDLLLGGCVGLIQNSTIEDVSIQQNSMTGKGKGTILIAGISGLSQQTSIEHITLTDIKIEGTATEEGQICSGGISGQNVANVTINNAKLCDIKLTSESVADIYSGGIAGFNNASPISNIKASGIILNSTTSKANQHVIGGLAGYNTSAIENIELDNITCSATATNKSSEKTTFLCAGGAIGYNSQNNLHNIYVHNVKVTTSSAAEKNISYPCSGGLIGSNTAQATFTLCAVDTCMVKGYKAGGMIAYNYRGNFIGCSATNANIESNSIGGGLIGDCRAPGNIFACYSTGKITVSDGPNATSGEKHHAGGLIGFFNGNTIEDSYSTCDVVNTTNNKGITTYAGSFLTYGLQSPSISCYSTGTVNNGQDGYFIDYSESYERSEIRFCYTTQNAILKEDRAFCLVGGGAQWDQLSPLPEDIVRTNATITKNGITWKASSLWLIPQKGAHPVINMNYHGEP